MSVDELSSKGSPQCKEAFEFLREQLIDDPNVHETVEYEPLKESEAPSYNVQEMQVQHVNAVASLRRAQVYSMFSNEDTSTLLVR